MATLHVIIQITGLFCLYVMGAGVFVGLCLLLYRPFVGLYRLGQKALISIRKSKTCGERSRTIENRK